MDLGVPELIIILVVVLVFFGPGKLPQIGDALGKSIRSFKRASQTDEPAELTPVREQLPATAAAAPAAAKVPVTAEKV